MHPSKLGVLEASSSLSRHCPPDAWEVVLWLGTFPLGSDLPDCFANIPQAASHTVLLLWEVRSSAQTRIVGTSPGNTAFETLNCFHFTFYHKTFQAFTLCLLKPLFHIKETSLYFWPLCRMPLLSLDIWKLFCWRMRWSSMAEHVLSVSMERKVVLLHFSSPKKTTWSLNLRLLKTVWMNLSAL